jgi:hypothetical protein
MEIIHGKLVFPKNNDLNFIIIIFAILAYIYLFISIFALEKFPFII